MSAPTTFLEIAKSQAFLDVLCEMLNEASYVSAVQSALADSELDLSASNFTFWRDGVTSISRDVAQEIVRCLEGYGDVYTSEKTGKDIPIKGEDIHRLQTIIDDVPLGKGGIKQRVDDVAAGLFQASQSLIPLRSNNKDEEQIPDGLSPHHRKKILGAQKIKEGAPFKDHIIRHSKSSESDASSALGNLLILTSGKMVEDKPKRNADSESEE